MVSGGAVVVVTQLHHHFVVLDRLPHPLGVRQLGAPAFFNVDVLLGLGSRNHDGRVPEIRGCNDHHINVRVLHYLFPFVHDADLRVFAECLGARDIARVQIAKNTDFGVRDCLGELQEIMPLRSHANAGYSNYLVRWLLGK